MAFSLSSPMGLSEVAAALPAEGSGRLGLVLKEKLGPEEWSKAVALVTKAAGQANGHRETLTAWLGDLLAYGGGQYKGQIKEYAEAAGMAPGALRIAKLVCLRIPPLRRRNGLSWSHHCEIASSFGEWTEIERWLDRAEREGLSRNALRRAIRKEVAAGRATRTSTLESAPFALLRELRSAARAVQTRDGIWNQWSPSACRQALNELSPLRQMLAELASKAG